VRLDHALVQRGLVDSRTKAQRRIRSGDVTADGVVVTKVSLDVSDDAVIHVAGDPDYVGRGALKLRAALEEWDISALDLVTLDVGASTGGFTQVLLENGARRVIALDVGRDQLHPSVREDPRVKVVEGFNVRDLTALWWSREIGEAPTLITCDVSFISLSQVLPAVTTAVGLCDWVVLIKPQFEVGKGGVKDGIVRDPDLRAGAIQSVLDNAESLGLRARGIIGSPISGEAGNREYLCWLSPTHGRNPSQWSEQIHQLAHS